MPLYIKEKYKTQHNGHCVAKIGDDMSINIESEASCRQAYLNYHCYGNTMNITAQEMGQITSRWENKLSSWQQSVSHVSNDENEYDFDDSDYAAYKEKGKQMGEDTTGGKPDTTAGAIQSYGSGVGALGSLVCAVLASCKVAVKPMLWIAAGLCAAVPTTYYAHKPNKDGKVACEAMQAELPEAQSNLSETQADMENIEAELIENSDEASELNEDANKEIEEQKTEFDMYRASYEAIKAKIDNGEPLTEDEKTLYKKCCEYMSDIGEDIATTQEDTTSKVGEIYEDMETYQDGYDAASETMGEVEGLTDYAESFDGKVRANCVAAQVALYANSTAGGVIAAKLLADGNLFTKIVSAIQAVLAIGGALASAKAAGEQGNWANLAASEIDTREATQDLNTDTMDFYDESVDDYASWMQGVEDLELEVPDDLEVPEPASVPTDGYPNDTPGAVKPKKEDEEA